MVAAVTDRKSVAERFWRVEFITDRGTHRVRFSPPMVPTIPDPAGLSAFDAALAYADAGLWLLPVATGKHPGSVVGNDWPALSTRDADVIAAYWYRPQPQGIAVHTGRSHLVAVDLDIDVIPDELAWLRKGLFQSSRGGRGERGHYVFASAEVFRNVKVTLSDGTEVGEIRSGNAVILVEPSPHPKAGDGGAYAWQQTGEVPELPGEGHTALAALSAKAGGCDADPISGADVAAWCERHTEKREPKRRKTFRDNYTKRVASGESRHAAMMSVLGWAAREVAPGLVAADVFNDLHADWNASFRGTDRAPQRGEFAGMLRTAIGKVATADDDPAMMADLLNRARRDFGTDHRDDKRDADALAGWVDRLRTESDETTPLTENDDASESDTGHDEARSSWAPVDVSAARKTRGQLQPTVGRRGDGQHLFYPAKVHSVHGESESGKSWFVLCVAAECLLAGRPVLFVDFEDDAAEVSARLLLLGVPETVVDDPRLFTYTRPEVEPKSDDDLEAFARLLSRRFDYAVIDGVTESMTIFGLAGKDNDDVANWQRRLPKAIARHTGAAVVCVDHVTKDADSRGRFALGGQHKMAGLDGAAFIVEPETPFARGLAGSASVRVGKDRPGCLRGTGGVWRKSDRTQMVATFRLDSTDAYATTWALDPPADTAKSGQVDRTTTAHNVARDAKTAKRIADRKWCMEQISAHIDSADVTVEFRTARKIVETLWKTHQDTKKIARNTWRDALSTLDDREFVTHSGDDKTGFVFASVKPYRAADDASDDGIFDWQRDANDDDEKSADAAETVVSK